MKLNHLDLQVPDVRATAAFLVRHFGLVQTSNPHSPAIAILSDEEGFTLVLQQRAPESAGYPEGFHIGFLVDAVETVHGRHAQLRAEPASRCSDVMVNGRGTLFFCTAPGDILVEVSCRPPGSNARP